MTKSSQTNQPKAKYNFKFSIIMSVYNTEKWLEEAVDSILQQDIGFEENVQVIFVNDGSPDNSETICRRYKKEYPDNFVYIKKQNGGLASARNVGLKHVRGECVSFFDPDDILSLDTLSTVYDFFSMHNDEIDLVSIKLEFFEARTGPHMLNYKFIEDKVVDLEKDFDYPQLSAASAFFKTSAIGDLRFDNELKFSEDARFVPVFISQKMKYGVVAKPTYYYRRRFEATSIINGRDKTNYWFLVVTDKVYNHLVEYSLKNYGKVLKFIQYTILYDLHGAIMDKNSTGVLTQHEYEIYKNRINKLMDFMDDDVITAEKNIKKEYKLFLLNRKRDEPVEDGLSVNAGKIMYRGNVLHKLKSTKVTIELVSIKNNKIKIEGRYSGFKTDGLKISFKVSGKTYQVDDVFRGANVSTYMKDTIYTASGFSVVIPLEHGSDIRAYIIAGNKQYRAKLVCKKTARLSSEIPFSYRKMGKWLVVYGKNSLTVNRATRLRHIKKEYKFLQELRRQNESEAVRVRLLAHMFRILNHRDVWLISDRLVCARDNGEALFRYLSNKKVSQKVYFAINKDSEDYTRMKQYGKVIDRQSLGYKLLFLAASKIISSHFDDFVINAFGEREENYRDLYRFDFVFLQHGITKDNMSDLLNKYRKDIKLLVTAARPEYKSFLYQGYGYDDSVIKLTGFPRFDLLESRPKKKLIIAPTWRKGIALEAKEGTDIRSYDSNFKKSKYFSFYNKLINDNRITSCLERNSMLCEFYVHPNFSAQAKDFKVNKRTIIKSMPYDYTQAFCEGDMLVTDYSSVAFDFAYLKKPIVYSQYDEYEFRSGHYAEGYFSYENDGFGPVETTYESTIMQIVKTIDAGCTMPQKYQKRVDRFYTFLDKNNSKRVYDAINAIGHNY